MTQPDDKGKIKLLKKYNLHGFRPEPRELVDAAEAGKLAALGIANVARMVSTTRGSPAAGSDRSGG